MAITAPENEACDAETVDAERWEALEEAASGAPLEAEDAVRTTGTVQEQAPEKNGEGSPTLLLLIRRRGRGLRQFPAMNGGWVLLCFSPFPSMHAQLELVLEITLVPQWVLA